MSSHPVGIGTGLCAFIRGTWIGIMMQLPLPRLSDEKGLSELLAEIFIVILIIALAVIIIGTVTGIIPKMLERPALLSAKASVVTTSSGADVISLLHQQGNPVNLNGSAQTAGISPVSFTLTTSTDIIVNVRNSSAIINDAWRPGTRVYLYQNGGRYFVTDDPDFLETQGAGIDIPSDSWSVNIIDTRVHLLLHKLPVTIP